MTDRDTTKTKFGQGEAVPYFLLATLFFIFFSGCSVFEISQDDTTSPGSSNQTDPVLPSGLTDGKSNAGTLSDSSNSSVPIKSLQDPKKATDVALELRLPDAPIEFLVINFGKSKTELSSHKRISKDALILVDEKERRYRYILKDAGELRPLFANIITEAGGYKSEPSETFEVTE